MLLLSRLSFHVKKIGSYLSNNTEELKDRFILQLALQFIVIANSVELITIGKKQVPGGHNQRNNNQYY